MLEALLRIVFQVRIHSLTDCFFGNPQPLARSVSEQADDMIIGARQSARSAALRLRENLPSWSLVSLSRQTLFFFEVRRQSTARLLERLGKVNSVWRRRGFSAGDDIEDL